MKGPRVIQGLEGIVFIGFVEFLGFVGLAKQGSVENYMLLSMTTQ